MSERVYRTLAKQDGMRGTVNEAVLRFALVLWVRDPANGLSDVQADWLRTRTMDLTPFTAYEHRKIVPRLLAWSADKDARHKVALVQGLRGSVEEGLLPARPEEVE